MRRRVASRRAADVREQHRVRRREQARVHLGLALVDVDPGAEDRAVLERDGERLLVDDRARARCSPAPPIGFISASRRASIEPASSSGVSGTCSDTMSTRGSRSSRSATHPVIPVSWRVWCSTSIPNPAARRATAWPMRP